MAITALKPVPPLLQHEKAAPQVIWARGMREAVRKYRKSVWSQAGEVIRLSFSSNRLSPREYFYYRLYNDEIYSFAEKKTFCGVAAQRSVGRKVTELDWIAIAQDKLVYHAVMDALGLPTPQILAVYHPVRRYGKARALPSPEALASYLRQEAEYPFFSKPIGGGWSVGVAAVQAFDCAADQLVLASGARIAVDDFVREIEAYRKSGYQFQRFLKPHPELDALIGPRVSTMRIVVLLEKGGASIFRALWKIPVGDNPADNFWRPGNMLAALDSEDGRVTRVVQGVGPDQKLVESHPDTGQRLMDVRIPDWADLKAVTLDAAAQLPGLRMQGWDVAPTDRGPVLVEVQPYGDFDLPQAAHGRGIMDDRLRAFLAECERERPVKGWRRLFGRRNGTAAIRGVEPAVRA